MAEAASLPLTDQIGRFGVFYVRSLLAQAGVAHSETSGGEDHLAVDITVIFPSGACCVQVKAGNKDRRKDGSITVPVNDEWKTKWSASALPVYLVYVHLEKELPSDWISHEDLQTVVHAKALWGQVNEVSGKSVVLPRDSQLTVGTFGMWAEAFDDQVAWGRAASA